jgi:hypothetical protein
MRDLHDDPAPETELARQALEIHVWTPFTIAKNQLSGDISQQKQPSALPLLTPVDSVVGKPSA